MEQIKQFLANCSILNFYFLPIDNLEVSVKRAVNLLDNKIDNIKQRNCASECLISVTLYEDHRVNLSFSHFFMPKYA
jgi:hypothetical protein